MNCNPASGGIHIAHYRLSGTPWVVSEFESYYLLCAACFLRHPSVLGIQSTSYLRCDLSGMTSVRYVCEIIEMIKLKSADLTGNISSLGNHDR